MSVEATKDFHLACHAIVEARREKALNYAVGYAQAGIGMTDPEACRVQAIYLLENITHWRGPVAVVVRNTLKRLVKAEAWE